MGLSEYFKLANIMTGAVWLFHYCIFCIVFLGIGHEILSVFAIYISGSIKVEENVFQIMTITAFSTIDEAVFVFLGQYFLCLCAVKSGDISKEALFKVRPVTSRHVETREDGVYNGEIRVWILERPAIV
jgi:hypothetical protein